MKRPRIGVTTSDRKSRIAWLFDRFALWRVGAHAVRLSPKRKVPKNLDGLILGGGDDIGVELYKGEVEPDVRIDPARDQLELDLLDRYLPGGMPILGICRGAQMINVHLGGSLHVDIHESHKHVNHRRTVLPRKTIEIEEHSRLHRILRVDRCRVNSMHHQAVDRVGRGLKVVARDRHGLVQGIESRHHNFLIGVQWHPEWLIFNRPQQRLMHALAQFAQDAAPVVA